VVLAWSEGKNNRETWSFMIRRPPSNYIGNKRGGLRGGCRIRKSGSRWYQRGNLKPTRAKDTQS